MFTKSKEHDIKFVGILATDIIKQLFDRFAQTDGWKNIFEILKVTKPTCQTCRKSFCSEKNLKTHTQKYHGTESGIKCDDCDFSAENKTSLSDHKQEKHTQSHDDLDQMDTDDNQTGVQNTNPGDVNETSDVNIENIVEELQNKIKMMVLEHENVVANLTTKLENKQNEYDGLKMKMDKLVKEEGKRSAEIKKTEIRE